MACREALYMLSGDFHYCLLYRLSRLVLAEVFEHHAARADRRKRIDDIPALVFRGRAAYGFEHRDAFRIYVSSRRDPHASLDHGPEVCYDVPEHVVSNDHVEPFRV